MMPQQLPRIGFIGLGNMGGRMAKNLYNAGYPLIGYDIDAEKCTALAATGATAGNDTAQVVENSDVIMTSLRSSDVFCSVAEQHLVPNAREGQVFIDLGTTEVEKTKELAAAFAEKGATLIDAPVSGGPHGSETGTLRIFVGGEAAAVEKCRPILEVLGEPKYVAYWRCERHRTDCQRRKPIGDGAWGRSLHGSSGIWCLCGCGSNSNP